MAKQLDIRINGRSFSVAPVKLERKKIYGWNEMRVVTPDGELCQQAGLNSDGITIIPAGNIKTGMLREDGLWMERSELITIDAYGNKVKAIPSSFDTGIDLMEKTSVEDMLDHNLASVYQMTGDEAMLLSSKIGDDIYKFPFSYRGGYEQNTAFIITNGPNVFIVVGNDGGYDYIGLEQQGYLDTVEEEMCLEEDMDFAMF